MQNKFKKIALFTAGVTCAVILTGCGSAIPLSRNAGEYTYNTYLTTNPATWNVHDWENSDESYITSFTEMGLYECILNETKDGHRFLPEMASEMPVKVSIADMDPDEYDAALAQYGYVGNIAEGMVWDISLNRNATWEDGTPITAEDYVQSMERQLNPKLVNFRADSFYASTLVLANAEKYFKSNRYTIEPLFNSFDVTTGKLAPGVAADGNYYLNLGRYTHLVSSIFSDADSTVVLYDLLNSLDQDTSTAAVRLACQRVIDAFCWYGIDGHYEFGESYEYKNDWAEAEKPSDINKEWMNLNINIRWFEEHDIYVRKVMNDSSVAMENRELYRMADLKEDLTTIVNAGLRKTVKNGWMACLFGSLKNAEFSDFEKVGIKKIDDYKIRLYLSQTIRRTDLLFSLTGNWLVKLDLYDDLTQPVTGNTGTGALWATKYATKSVENYMSYGPYRLAKYDDGKSFEIVRNEKWYGYNSDLYPDRVGQFQMTRVKTTIYSASQHDSIRVQFEKGYLDDFALDRDDMDTYGFSKRRTSVPESYTQKLSFNSDRNKLLAHQANLSGVNKTILANDNFRKGLSLAFNRVDFAANETAGSTAFTGLLNELYMADVDTGEMYRDTVQGKSVYGMVYNELGGDPYAADYKVQPLAESEQGYNFQMAKKFVADGIKEELKSEKEGHLQPKDTILLEIRVYDDQSESTKGTTKFIDETFDKVVRAANEELKKDPEFSGTELDVKFDLKTVKDEDYYNSAKSGNYDMIFSIWGGAAINPYGLMQVYCDPSFESTCEYGFKGKQADHKLEIDLDGNGEIDESTEIKSFNDWYLDVTKNVLEPDLDGVDREAEENATLVENYNKVHNKRLSILAGLEAGILNRFEAVPLVSRASSSLTSLKVNNGTTKYINLVGFGGVRFMTFNYDDAEWYAFITSKDYSKDLYL